MIDFKDEILNGSAKYRIRDSNNNIIFDNLTIEQITEVIQQGTPLNREAFENVKHDIYMYEVPDYTPSGEIISQNNIVPTMQSSTQDGVTVTGVNNYAKFLFSSTYEDRYSESGLSDYYIQLLDSLSDHITIQFNDKYVKCNKFKIYASRRVSKVAGVILQASNDGQNWIQIVDGYTTILQESDNTKFTEYEIIPNSNGFWKYYRIDIINFGSSGDPAPVRLRKVNIEGEYVEGGTQNNFDLNLGFTEYAEGMKLKMNIPEYQESLPTKFQLDGLGYKDIYLTKGYGEYIYSNDAFHRIPYVYLTYIGTGVTTSHIINLGFKPKLLIINDRTEGNRYIIGADGAYLAQVTTTEYINTIGIYDTYIDVKRMSGSSSRSVNTSEHAYELYAFA